MVKNRKIHDILNNQDGRIDVLLVVYTFILCLTLSVSFYPCITTYFDLINFTNNVRDDIMIQGEYNSAIEAKVEQYKRDIIAPDDWWVEGDTIYGTRQYQLNTQIKVYAYKNVDLLFNTSYQIKVSVKPATGKSQVYWKE